MNNQKQNPQDATRTASNFDQPNKTQSPGYNNPQENQDRNSQQDRQKNEAWNKDANNNCGTDKSKNSAA